MRKLLLIITVFLNTTVVSQTDTLAYINMIVEKPFLQRNGLIEYKTSRGITTDTNEYEYIKTWFINKVNSSSLSKLRSEKNSFMGDTVSLSVIFDGNQYLYLNNSIKTSYLISYKNYSKNIIIQHLKSYRTQFLPSFMICERAPDEVKNELYYWFQSGDAQLIKLPDTVLGNFNCFGFLTIDTTCHISFEKESEIPGEECYSLRSETRSYFNKNDSLQIYIKTDYIFNEPKPIASQWDYVVKYDFNDTNSLNNALYQINTDTLKSYFLTHEYFSNRQLTSTVRNIPFTKAPDIEGVTYNGDTFNLYNIKAKLILIDFWAKFCSPCLSQMEDFKKYYNELKELGLETFGINSQDIPSENMQSFLNNKKFAHPLIYSKPAANMYRVIAIPLYFLLDENYMIIESFYSLDHAKISEIKKRLQTMKKNNNKTFINHLKITTMGNFTKNHMHYCDYSWTVYGNDNPKVTGEPDNTQLNRKEGYEMLYFINKFAEIYKLHELSKYVKIERMIREKVPTTIHTQKEIKEWIYKNWN